MSARPWSFNDKYQWVSDNDQCQEWLKHPPVHKYVENHGWQEFRPEVDWSYLGRLPGVSESYIITGELLATHPFWRECRAC